MFGISRELETEVCFQKKEFWLNCFFLGRFPSTSSPPLAPAAHSSSLLWIPTPPISLSPDWILPEQLYSSLCGLRGLEIKSVERSTLLTLTQGGAQTGQPIILRQHHSDPRGVDRQAAFRRVGGRLKLLIPSVQYISTEIPTSSGTILNISASLDQVKASANRHFTTRFIHTSSSVSAPKMSAITTQVVHDHYSALAREDATKNTEHIKKVAESFGYSAEDLAGIPEEANLGVSCGNPLAVAGLKAVC